MDLSSWTPRKFPAATDLEGRYARLEPLNVEKHCEPLFHAVNTYDAEERFRYVLHDPPKSLEAYRQTLTKYLAREDSRIYVVIDKKSGKIGGKMTYRYIDVENGTAFLGVFWTDVVARKPAATECVYLMAKYLFYDLGYRRLSWRCLDGNLASKKSALRFGFTYECHTRKVVRSKGEDRTASCVFVMLDKDWWVNRMAMEGWLDPTNFDGDLKQKERLVDIRGRIATEMGVSLPSIDPPPPEISVEESEHNALSIDMRNWTPRQPPSKVLLKGQYVYLEPLDIRKHGDGLYEVCTMPDGDKRFDWLPEHPAKSREEFQAWLEKAQASTDPLYFVVIDKASGKVAGRQTFLRIVLDHGVIEVGHILWSSIIARKPAATEALYLFAKYMFDDLGYRRFEWKCNNLNEASKKAAIRFGFRYEGIFRQHMVVKGQNRDTAWFAMLNSDWPLCKQAFEKWLDPENFDENGQQKRKLNDIRDEIKVNLFKN